MMVPHEERAHVRFIVFVLLESKTPKTCAHVRMQITHTYTKKSPPLIHSTSYFLKNAVKVKIFFFFKKELNLWIVVYISTTLVDQSEGFRFRRPIVSVRWSQEETRVLALWGLDVIFFCRGEPKPCFTISLVHASAHWAPTDRTHTLTSPRR